MISLTVKTLDGRSHDFTVENECTVDQFKSQAEEKLGVSKAKQRLIFLGKALQDDKLLREYGVANKVLHLVERAPPPAATSASASSGATGHGQPSGRSTAPTAAPSAGQNFAATDGPPLFLQNLLTSLVSTLSGATAAGGAAGSQGVGEGTRPAVDVHINLDVFRSDIPVSSLSGGPGQGPTAHSTASAGTTAPGASSSSASRPAGASNLGAQPSAGQPQARTQQQVVQEHQTRIAREATDSSSHYLSQAARHLNRLQDCGTANADVLSSLSNLEIPPAPTRQASSTTPSTSSSSSNTTGANTPQGQQHRIPASPYVPPSTIPPSRSGEIAAIMRRQLVPCLQSLIPAVQQCADILECPTSQTSQEQQLVDSVMETIHCLAHSCSSLGDLDVDVTQGSPRNTTMLAQRQQQQQQQQQQQGLATASVSATGSSGNAQPTTSSQSTPASSSPPAPAASSSAGSQPGSRQPASSQPGSSQPGSSQPFPFPFNPQGMQAFVLPQLASMPLGGALPAGNFSSMALPGGAIMYRADIPIGPYAATSAAPSSASSTSSSSTSATTSSGTASSSGTAASTGTTASSTAASSNTPGATATAFPLGGQSPFPFFLPPGGGFPPPTVRVQTRAQVIPPVAGTSLINVCGNARHNCFRPQSASGSTPSQPHIHVLPQQNNLVFGPFSNPPVAGFHMGPRPSAAPAPGASSVTSDPSGASSTQSSTAPGATPASGGAPDPGMPGDTSVHRLVLEFNEDGSVVPSDDSAAGAAAAGNVFDLMQYVYQPGGAQVPGSTPASGQPPIGASLYDLMEDLGADSEDEDDGPLGVLIGAVLRVLSGPDLMALLRGSHAPLDRVGPALRTALCERVLEPELPLEEGLRVAGSRVAADCEAAVREAVVGVEVHEGVRICETLLQEIRTLCVQIFRTIHTTSPDSENYGTLIAEQINREFSNTVSVLAHGLVDERNSLHRVLQRLLEYMLRGQEGGEHIAMMSPMFYYNSLHMVVDRARARCTLSTEELDARMVRVVRPSRTCAAASSTAATASAAPISSSSSASAPPSQSATTNDPRAAATSSSSTSAAASGDSLESYAVAANGSHDEAGEDDDWQGMVPSSWIPVIADDIIRQRFMPSRRPHSDGYASTQSSNKRRKTDSSPSSETSTKLPDAVKQAIRDAGVEPVTSLNDVVSAVQNNTPLQDAYESTLQDLVSNRLQADPDYDPQHYPNLRSLFG